MPDETDTLVPKISESLANAEAHAQHLHKTNRRLLIAAIITSAGATLVTALAAAGGPVIGEGTAGWKISCAIAAVFGFATTVSVALNQQLGVADRLSNANACAGRLRSLDVSITTGSREWSDITAEYEAIVREYPEEIRGRSG